VVKYDVCNAKYPQLAKGRTYMVRVGTVMVLVKVRVVSVPGVAGSDRCRMPPK